MPSASTTIAVVIGNRDFFPDHLVSEARRDVLQLFEAVGITPVIVSEEETKLGGVETHAEARGVPTCSSSTATRSMACSWCCPTSATKRGSPTR